jgi:hypothetical protein
VWAVAVAAEAIASASRIIEIVANHALMRNMPTSMGAVVSSPLPQRVMRQRDQRIA